VTDTIKALLGGAPEDAWGPLIASNLLLIALALAAIVLLVILLYRFMKRNTPRPEHKMGWRADDNNPRPSDEQFALARRIIYERIFDRDLLEKIVLVSFIVYIFSNILPNTTLPGAQIVISMAFFVIVTTAISHILARRGTTIASGFVHFLAVFAVNMGITYLIRLLLGGSINWANAALFQVLLAVIVTLFDRYQPFHLARFPRDESGRPPEQSPAILA
jgi:hypothetical protein